ncbi:MAG: GNAT family N-acetyltransferase [Sedimenticola sp.]
MDEFLHRHAANHAKQGISSTWVLPVLGDPGRPKTPIAVYYTLATSTVAKDEIPYQKSLPPYQVGVVLLARLAVALDHQGQQLGAKTLVTALRKAVELTTVGLPALGLILDVLDEDALAFYQRFELFEPFTDNPMRLFVPMTAIRSL